MADPDGTPGLALVPAVAEATRRGDRVDVVERGLDADIRAGHLERADARRVDEHRAAGQGEQLAMGRRVAAPRVGCPDLAGRLALLAQQRVQQRRLADARRPEHDRRSPGAEERSEVADVVAGQRGQDDDRDAGRDGLDRHEPTLEVEGDVGLVQDDDRGHAARPGHRQVALEASQVEVVVETGDEERHVDVRREHLLVGKMTGVAAAPVGRAAHERRTARQHGRDDRGLAADRHPVPDRRIVRRGEGLEPKAAGHGRRRVAAMAAADDGRLLVHRHDPGRVLPVRRDRGEGGRPVVVPARKAVFRFEVERSVGHRISRPA